MSSLVAPEHRPTLPELVGARVGRRGLVAVSAVAVLPALLLAFLVLRPEDDSTDVVSTAEPAPFHFRYTAGLERVAPKGDELVRLEARRGELFIQSFAVSPLRLPPYRGETSGSLPVFAAGEIEALRARFAEFELVQDAKTRVNDVAGHVILFRARLGERRLYGRQVLLPEPLPGTRDGVRLLLLATPAGGVSRASEVGVRGVVKRPYRTFRFGTDTP